MQSNLDAFRAQLDKDHAKVVGLWKARYRKAVLTSTLLFVALAAFVGMYLMLDNDRAGLVALLLVALNVSQAWVLTREEHEWSRSLVEAGRCNSYRSLLTRHPAKTEMFQIRNRPIYMADFLALQDFVEAQDDGGFDRAELDAAKWLEQGMPALAGAQRG
ncbi:hypothetical protein [Acidovorax sp. sic0104]|uniref:hypothetical protein n=1 Tax=Acidovorax sp. sic0104 TaxID=2854784 RepID=UPI001C48614F|nr:hypothetical protein [Acidovorax sp. sic0104]MBV7542059.1 hypothetical protein [Acidovorax sp. sic0104]